MEQKTGWKEAFLRLVAIVGLIAVLILGAWGIILLAFNLVGLFNGTPVNFGSMWGNAKEEVVITLPSTVASGKSFSASWKHTNAPEGDYSFAVSYACEDGLSLEGALPAGGYQAIDCETPFNFTGATEKMMLIARNSGDTTATAEITVASIDIATGDTTSSGTKSISVKPAAKTTNVVTTPKPTTTVTTPKPTVVYTPAVQSAPLYGLPDLRVTISSVTSLSSVQGRTSVQFVVENIGTNVARSGWTFNALLPLTPSYTYQSNSQQALNPGDKIAYTLTYDDPTYRNYNQYNQNQVCTLQYPNYNCNYQNQYQYQNNYNYQYNTYNTPTTCYTYNGYVNIAGPCTNDNTVYNPNYNYYTGSNNYGYYPYGGTVTITVDPQNWVQELIEYNNSASKSIY